ncbi:MAG: flagellar motor switch protein FliM [candidate division Zixibacteria bacterium]|nr:flagellar motor switch protein FliM [candidate division Zixibacteria bacterium]
MVKILAQDEIDALIASADGGEIAEESFEEPKRQEKNIVSYDFKHPNRVNKDQIRSLESMHDNFANHLGSAYSAYTRSMVDVDLVAVDQITYAEYIMSLSSPSCTYIFQMEPLEGAGVINYNSNVAFFIVDRIFGGRGKGLEADRELTGIERSIMNKVLNKTLTGLEKAWEHILPINLSVSSYETNPQFVQVVPPGETVITVSLQIRMSDSHGVMTICYPYISLEDIIQKLSAQHFIDTSKKRLRDFSIENNIRRMNDINTNISVQLEGTSITMRELLKLNPGDVLCLDNSVNDDFSFLIHGERKFMGRIGNVKNKKAIQLTSVVEAGEFKASDADNDENDEDF